MVDIVAFTPLALRGSDLIRTIEFPNKSFLVSFLSSFTGVLKED